MQPLKTAALIALCASIILSTFCGTSTAITGNSQPDPTPYVCVVVLFSDAARTQAVGYGTGVLVSPNMVLTAGHCVLGGVAASVCFDQGPINVSLGSDKTITYEANAPVYDGTPIAYPEYIASVMAGAKASKVLQTSDVGLIILDEPVQEVTTYAVLPPAGLADDLEVNQELKVMGYGAEFQITPRGEGFYTLDGSLTRSSATVQLLSTHFQGSSNYLKCTANAAQGKGGIEFGDSGGPVLYSANGESILLAVNAYVANDNCAGVSYHTRIDTAQVLGWINGYL